MTESVEKVSMVNQDRPRKRPAESKDSNGNFHVKKNCSIQQGHGNQMRAGKWSIEEEEFANRLVLEFERGWLKDCEEGCTLRSYLARRLNCAPMRISKKFAGRCIGKLVFAKGSICMPQSENNLLDELENNYKLSYDRQKSLEMNSMSNDEEGVTSAEESGNDSSIDTTENENDMDKDFSTESRHIISSSSSFSDQGGLGADDLDFLRFEFFDSTPLCNENLNNCAGTIVEPHEWQDVLSFFCDDGYSFMV